MSEKEEKIFEIYTVSGSKITVRGSDIFIDKAAGDLTILDFKGEHIAQFELMNIEGWRLTQ